MTICKTMYMQSIKTERTDPANVTAFGSTPVSSASSGNLASAQNLSQNGNFSIHPLANEMAQRNMNMHVNVTNQQAGYHGIMNETNHSFSKPLEKIENLENLVDFPSIKGLFGWTTVDDVNVPYILRHDKRFVSVRIVELKLLSRYPNAYPDELGRHKPLTSFFITHNEARLLNEINLVHCGGEYGRKEFSQKDLIVLLSDFVEFYNLVKKTFPESNTTKQTTKAAEEKELSSYCGWLQINNTVTPYVKRPNGKYVPLSVIRYAAGLMTSENDSVKGVLPTQIECDLMNKACKLAGFNFNFAKTTRIIALTDILQTNFVHVTELPMENPLSHAHYMELVTNKLLLSGPCEPNRQNPAYPNIPNNQNSLMQLPHRNIQPDKSQQGNMLNTMGNIPTHLMRPPPPYPGIFNPRLPFMTPFNGFQSFPGMPQPNPMGDFPPVPPNASLRPHMSSGPGPPTGGMQRPMLLPYILPQGQVQFQGGGSLNRPLPSPHSSRPGSAADLNKRSPGHVNGPSPLQESRPSSGHHPSSLVLPSKSPYGPQEVMFPAPGNVLTNPAMQRNMIPGQQMFPFFPMPTSTQPNPGQSIRSPTNLNPGMLVGIQAMQQQVKNLQQINNIRTPVVTCESDIPLVTKTQEKLSQSTSSSTNVVSAIPGLYSPPKQQPSQKKISNSAAGIGGPPPLLMMAPSGMPISASSIVSSADTSKSIDHGKQETTIIDLANTSPPKPSQEVDTKEKPLQIGADFIKGAWLNGKSISCLHIETPERKGRYCLVEAVCKLYFNGGSVNEFLFALENVLNVPLLTCTDEEEKAFIQYYNLPVTVLKCNKMISFDDLKNFFPQLSYMFPEKQQTLNSDSTNGNQPNSSDLSQTIEENNNIPASDLTGFIAIPLGSLSDLPSVNGHLALSSSGGEKRHHSSHDEGPAVKQAKFLESALQKLRTQQQQLQGGKIDDSGSNQQHQSIAEDAVIVLD